MINSSRWFINLEDGRTVQWTSEIESNYKFKEVSFKVVKAIDDGKISWRDVVEQINKQLPTLDVDTLIAQKIKMNVRETKLNLEDQAQADNTQKDTGKSNPYEVTIPEAEAPKAEAPKATTTKKGGAKAKETEAPAVDPKVAAAVEVNI